ncbi:MAG: DegV family protein [Alicyclobacillaceae bacterium]|nr:DegV family protein [Alicyclobacillaceae bacterium]
MAEERAYSTKGTVAVVVDSTAGIPEEVVRRHRLTVVPLTVLFGEKVYREGVDLSPAEFYARLREAPQLPTTSQPPVGEFVSVFSRLLDDHRGVVCILLSGALSGTVQAARAAAASVRGPVAVVDSRTSSYGLEALAVEAARMAEAGHSPDEIAERVTRMAQGIRAYFVVDDLAYLRRGGRLGSAQAVLGTVLQVKPILTLEDGRLALQEKVRTRRRAVDRIVELWEEALREGPQRVCVIHADRAEDAEDLRARVAARIPGREVPVRELGPVLGTHGGPGVLALMFFPEECR